MTRTRLLAISLVLTGLILASAALAGCNVVKPKMQSVPDLGSAFHFYIPATWRENQTPGLIAVYASETLPSDPKAAQSSIDSAPSFLVITSAVPQKVPIADELAKLVKLRQDNRKWKAAQIGQPVATTVGGLPASRVDVTGTDATGVGFKSSYYLIRTADHEYFLAAQSSPEKWDGFSKQVDTILKDWYWQSKPGSTPVSGTIPTQ